MLTAIVSAVILAAFVIYWTFRPEKPDD